MLFCACLETKRSVKSTKYKTDLLHVASSWREGPDDYALPKEHAEHRNSRYADVPHAILLNVKEIYPPELILKIMTENNNLCSYLDVGISIVNDTTVYDKTDD